MINRIRFIAAIWISLTCLNGMGQYSTHYLLQKSVFESIPDTDEGEIIFLGNSITVGGPWGELFNDLRVKNRGISGDVTGGILYWLEEVVERNPAKIFLLIGINDLARGVPIDTIYSNISAIIMEVKLKTPGTVLYIQSILPVNDEIGSKFQNHVNKSSEIIRINTRLQKMAEGSGLCYVELHASFANSDGKLDAMYTNDGLHINGAGYQLWKSLVEKYVYE